MTITYRFPLLWSARDWKPRLPLRIISMKVSEECIHGVLQTNNSINYTLKQKRIVITLSPNSLKKANSEKYTKKLGGLQ